MRLPSPPSNPVTNALEQAAEQVADAAEQVFEAAIDAAGDVQPENAEQAALKVLKASLLLAKAAKDEAAGRLVARVDEGVASQVDSAGAVIVIGVAVIVVTIGMVVAGTNAASQAASRVAVGVARVGFAVAAYPVARSVADCQEVGKRLRGESFSVRTAVTSLEGEIGRLRARRGDTDRIDARRAERDSILDNLGRAARLVVEAAAAIGGGAPAGGGATQGQGATSGPGGVRSLERIERLADRLKGLATRRGNLPPDVHAQFIEACRPMPRIARPGMATKAGTAVPTGRLRQRVARRSEFGLPSALAVDAVVEFAQKPRGSGGLTTASAHAVASTALAVLPRHLLTAREDAP